MLTKTDKVVTSLPDGLRLEPVTGDYTVMKEKYNEIIKRAYSLDAYLNKLFANRNN